MVWEWLIVWWENRALVAKGGPLESLWKARLLLVPIQLGLLNLIAHCSCFLRCKKNKMHSSALTDCRYMVGDELADRSEMLTPGSQEQEHKSTITSRSTSETQLKSVRPNPGSPEISAHCLIRDLGGACQANPGSGRYRRNKTPSLTPYCELYCTLCV